MLSRVASSVLTLALCLAQAGPVVGQDRSGLEQPDSAKLAAAIAGLSRLHEELVRRRQALQSGRPVEPDGERRFEDQVALVQILIKSHDPVVIRPLLSNMIGTAVTDAIAAFGELAVADVIAAVSEPELETRSDALTVLQKMLESPVRHPLSNASKQSIIEIAQRELSGNSPMVIIWRAVELAVATRDPSLLNRVRQIATNESAIRALNIAGPKEIEWVRGKARAALAARGLGE